MAEGFINPAYEATEESDITVVFSKSKKQGELLQKVDDSKETNNPNIQELDDITNVEKGIIKAQDLDNSNTENSESKFSNKHIEIYYDDNEKYTNGINTDNTVDLLERRNTQNKLDYGVDSACIKEDFGTELDIHNCNKNLNKIINISDDVNYEEDIIAKFAGPVFRSFRDRPVRNVWKRRSLVYERQIVPVM